MTDTPSIDRHGPPSRASRQTSLRELALLFLKLGATSFGGPAAHVAMMEDEVVRRRGWLTRDQFLDYLGATNLLPGPNSTEMAIHIGLARAGWRGLLIAGISFILPAVLMVGAAAFAYVRYGAVPQVAGPLYGIKAVVIAIVAHALWTLGHRAVRSIELACLGVAAVVAAACGAHELLVILGAGLAMAAGRLASPWLRAAKSVDFVSLGWGGTAMAAAAAALPVSFGLWPLFLVFVKAGALLFGSGYVLLAFLRADLVERLRWLTEAQLLDAIAIGQATPGPLFTTATFIGYVLGGPAGAVVATLGIFLPAFVFVAASGRIVPRVRQSPAAAAVLDGVNVASLALMGVVSWHLGRAALVDPLTVTLAVASAIALAYRRMNSAWLIACGAAAGWLMY